MKMRKVKNCNRKHNNISLRGRNIKGKNNPNWKGGIAEYPNHSLMKKNRLIKLKQTAGKCEICGRKTEKMNIHHLDGSKSNHSLDNLILLCRNCHCRLHRGRKAKTSIWIRRYGATAKELCRKLQCSFVVLQKWHKQDWVDFFMGKKIT